MRIVTLNENQFDKYAKTNKYRNYYQTSSYGKLMTKFGFNILYIGITDDVNVLIGASLIIYREVFMNNKLAYAPRGILFNYEDSYLINELSKLLKEVFSKQGFMALKIDPYIPATIRDNEGNIINFNTNGKKIMENLKSAGFIYSGTNLFFENEKQRWEAIITLGKDIREIFKNFTKRTKHKIRKAANSGIEVYKSENKDINIIYDFIKLKSPKPIEFYQELCKEYDDKIDIYYAKINTEVFVINMRKSYEKEMEKNNLLARKVQNAEIKDKKKQKILNSKMESDKLLNTYKNSLILATELLKKYPDGLIVGGSININYDNAAFVYIDGFSKTYSSLNPSYLIKWRMIDDYNKRGFKYLNLNAVVGEFERKNKYSGLNEMKLGFNPVITEYIGEFDIILNNFNYNLYKSFNRNK